MDKPRIVVLGRIQTQSPRAQPKKGGGLKNKCAVASAVGINTAREYANWGVEFVYDAFRFGEQPYQVSDDWPGEIGDYRVGCAVCD